MNAMPRCSSSAIPAQALAAYDSGLSQVSAAKFTRLRHGVKRPQQLSARDIKAPDILLEPGHNDDLLENSRRGGGRPESPLRHARQKRLAAFAEVGDELAALRVERVEELAGAEHHPLPRPAPSGPINQPPKGGAALGLEAPHLSAGRRVDGHHMHLPAWA